MPAKFRECEGQGAAVKSADPGVVENVKVLGWESVNSRTYDKTKASEWLPLYEGSSVNIDHNLTGDQRSVSARFGWLEGVQVKDDGIYAAKLKYNPKHPFAESFEWWVANNPAKLGLSHSVEGENETREGKEIITKIHKVYSVDVVADPATVKGMYEAVEMDPETLTPPTTEVGSGDWMSYIGQAIAALVKSSLDPAAKKKKIMALLKLEDDNSSKEPPKKEDEPAEPAEEAVKLVTNTNKLIAEAGIDISKIPVETYNQLLSLKEDAAKIILKGMASFMEAKPTSAIPATPVTKTDLDSLAQRLRGN